VEAGNVLQLANLVTWSKKRAYGTKTNYLFTREECAYFIKGDAKHPRCFNVPYLATKRGYAGYNAKYPAKSEYYRRTNVWTDINEIFRGKLHPTQKQQRLYEVMIEIHTVPGEWVVDPFCGAGTAALACRKLGRQFCVLERDPVYYNRTVELLKGSIVGP
jgi:site-specific DNA-methyltransferase (adenine-specific)